MISHDTTCGKKEQEGYKGPIQPGGVGGVLKKSFHGIYQIKLPLISGAEAVLSGLCLNK